jgi:hypothetical protein
MSEPQLAYNLTLQTLRRAIAANLDPPSSPSKQAKRTSM